MGGGPAGLSAAIRMKQLEKEKGGEEKRVVVLEKGAEVGESFAALRRRKERQANAALLIGSGCSLARGRS